MLSVSSFRFHSNRTAGSRVGPALFLALALLLPSVATAARIDPVLVRRAAARHASTGPMVEDVVFVGNDAFDEDLLFGYMHTRESGLLRKSYYDRRTFLQDLANLERFYVSQGFLEADVEMDDISLSADSTRVEILIGVYEGDRWMVESVTFEGESVIPEDELRALVLLDEGSPFILGFIERDRRVVSEEYARRSYLDARVLQVVTRDDDRRLVAIDYAITERERATIASIDVEGDEKVRKFVVERELTFHEGELFDFRKIGESQAHLYRTGLFNSVWIEPAAADTGKPAKRVIVRVGERASGEFDLSGSYAGVNLEGLRGLDFLELGAEFRNRNVQGQATNMTLGGRYSGLARDVRASVGDPWFLGKRVAAEFAVHYEWMEEKNSVRFVTEVTSGSFVMSKKFGLNVALEGGYEYSHNYDESDDNRSTETSALLIGTVYDSRNDVLSASRGMFLRGEVDIASSHLGGMNDFTRVEVDWRGYVRPIPGRVAALQLRAGWIEPSGDDSEVPGPERYLADRAGLVRGLPREALGPLDDDGTPTGGLALVLARGEIRFPVRKSLRGAAFVDAGRVFGHIEDLQLSRLEVGAGLGLRFETRIGVLRLDVGIPLSREGEPQYYFGVGQAF
ncbi:MAG: BamA/TamA family outer membrane protein [Candidatus Eisenbacteria bacterium]